MFGLAQIVAMNDYAEQHGHAPVSSGSVDGQVSKKRKDMTKTNTPSADLALELLDVLSEAIEYYAPCIIDDESQPHSHDEMIAKMEEAISNNS